MTEFFQFEADFVDSLRCIPMQVRLKLDTCGIKLKLPQWLKFSPEERQALVDRPCTTQDEVKSYREFLENLVLERSGTQASDLAIEENPAWMNATMVPNSVQEQAEIVEATITLEQWASLTPIQRFALIKLSRSEHENSNFFPALREFNLA